MFYRVDKEKNIIDSANYKYADDCLETDKNIIRGFNGQLVFEEETLTDEYKLAEEKYKTQIDNDKIIFKLKQNLSNTDYQAIKYGEGELNEEEYAPIKTQRKEWRAEINRLEEELKNGN